MVRSAAVAVAFPAMIRAIPAASAFSAYADRTIRTMPVRMPGCARAAARTSTAARAVLVA
jgi:hypothetical protein